MARFLSILSLIHDASFSQGGYFDDATTKLDDSSIWGGNSREWLDSKRPKCALVGVEVTNCHALELWVSYRECRFGAC